jgi:methylmalonyl-CoA/ethylmalonyl-CoA epimerase
MDGRLLDEDKVMQICFVTADLAASMAWFEGLTGKKAAHVGGAAPHDVARATHLGQPAEVSCRLALYRFGNIDVEFLEPGPEPSVWRSVLEDKGPGCHHIAFKTRNLTRHDAFLRQRGHPLLQGGEFQGGHGRYAYYDTARELGVLVELLEFDADREPQ